jgi:mannose-6-phosphate isomerase-like protein (cupin superfamily)
MAIRRVVTGTDADGKSVFFKDELVAPKRPRLLGGQEIWTLGGDDGMSQLPLGGEELLEEGTQYFPPASGGYRYTVFTIPPGGLAVEPLADQEQAMAEIEEELPGVTQAITDETGMHATDTVDFDYVLEGEVELRVGDETTVLNAGDCVILTGTFHAWKNKSPNQWVKILAFFVGAQRSAG